MKTKLKQIATGFAQAIRRNSHRILPVVVMLVIYSLPALAAGEGTNVFDSTAGTIGGYVPGVKKLLYAVAACIALVGAFNVYHKMTNGDQDVKKTIMLTLGGCIAMLALTEALPSLFGYSAG